MKIAIIGVGAVGGFFGGLLAKANNDVTFIARGEQYVALKNNGLSVSSTDGDYVVNPVKVVDKVSKLEKVDLILICTKTYHRDEIARQIIEIAKDDTIIIPLQNGIDNDLRIKEICKIGKCYPGLVYLIASRTQPGMILQTAGPKMIFFGKRGSEPNEELKEIEKIFRASGSKPRLQKILKRKFGSNLFGLLLLLE